MSCFRGQSLQPGVKGGGGAERCLCPGERAMCSQRAHAPPPLRVSSSRILDGVFWSLEHLALEHLVDLKGQVNLFGFGEKKIGNSSKVGVRVRIPSGMNEVAAATAHRCEYADAPSGGVCI